MLSNNRGRKHGYTQTRENDLVGSMCALYSKLVIKHAKQQVKHYRIYPIPRHPSLNVQEGTTTQAGRNFRTRLQSSDRGLRLDYIYGIGFGIFAKTSDTSPTSR